MTPLGRNGHRARSNKARSLCAFFRWGQASNRLEYTLAVTQQNANLNEIRLRQFRQNVRVNFVCDERGFILTEIEAAQPSPDIHYTPQGRPAE